MGSSPTLFRDRCPVVRTQQRSEQLYSNGPKPWLMNCLPQCLTQTAMQSAQQVKCREQWRGTIGWRVGNEKRSCVKDLAPLFGLRDCQKECPGPHPYAGSRRKEASGLSILPLFLPGTPLPCRAVTSMGHVALLPQIKQIKPDSLVFPN